MMTGKEFERMYVTDKGRVPLAVLFDNCVRGLRADLDTVRAEIEGLRKNCNELQQQTSHLRGLLREVGRTVVEMTGAEVHACGGLGDALHWEDVPSLIKDCLWLALPNKPKQGEEIADLRAQLAQAGKGEDGQP